jgi:hypothetical protein
MYEMDRSSQRNKRWIWIGLILILGISCVLLLSNWAAIGTSLANPMRKLLGVERVAQLESTLFNAQDSFKQWQYRLGIAEPESPWAVAGNPGDSSPSDPANPAVTPQTTDPPPVTPLPTATQSLTDALATSTPLGPLPTATLAPSPTPASWTLADLDPFGDSPGEGVWQPYIEAPDGDVVALRTFLQPDPERPYALVAVVAFDLSKTQLHYVLGLKEPAKPGGPHGWGVIPDEDKQPGKLLAAFNGGFIAEHGYYGAMANGVTALAGKAGLATLGIYKDGSVRIGEWGKDLSLGEDFAAWRQNALLIIDDGQINPKVHTGTYIEWGANLDGAIVTLRSAIGISEDNQVLYYFAGPSLSMPVLADAMARAGAYNGLLMDINPTHAHFTAMRESDGKLVAESLYAEVMDLWIDRYLGIWDQDFFYVTTKE